MLALQLIVAFAIALTSNAFRGALLKSRSSKLSMAFDFDKVVNDLSRNKILTKTSQLGLLSKLERSGIKLSTAKPLLVLADELDLIGVLEASSEKVLPLIAKGVELAPALLPLAGVAVKTPPTTLFGGAVASLAAAAAVLSLIPDDSIGNIALQTALVVPLGVLLPGALAAGGAILSKLK